jgi:hypothetical protein
MVAEEYPSTHDGSYQACAIKNWRVDVKTNAPGNLKALMLEPMPALV